MIISHSELASMLWGFVSSGLIIYFLLSSLIYIQTRQKAYFYYAFYNILLFIFLIRNSPYLPEEYGFAFQNSRFFSLVWFIQVVYNSLLFFFYLAFLELKFHFPKYTSVLLKVLQILIGLSFLLAVHSVISGESVYFKNFFNFGFLPLITILVISSIYVTYKTQNNLKFFVISGVIVYQSFAYIALVKSMYFNEGVYPIVYFYIGIIIESTIFMLGIGYKVNLLYQDKINVQKKIIEEQRVNQGLKDAYQKELEVKLEEKITELKIALQKNEAEKVRSLTLSFENEISHLKLDALRTQMNPHFIFNALNSIKAYLIDNNKEKAVYYLNKFAKLIRKILEGSRTDSVTLDEELETIELYMNIENIRFNETVNFIVSCGENVNLTTIKLPGLILQPFIENSLWHGLSIKEGAKNITIEVFTYGNVTSLSITDNGIGRQKARGNSEKKTFKKESLGIQFAQERLNYFNRKHNTNYSFTISDLYDVHQAAKGTQVVFNFLMN
ncbi:MAG: histidine kinase [Bacteroidota bacterium]